MRRHPCGRIDVHPPHHWSTPHHRDGYTCPGTPTVTRAERPTR